MRYVKTLDVVLTRHGGLAEPGRYDVLVTQNFGETFDRHEKFWPVGRDPLEHDMWSFTAVVDDFGTLIPVDPI